MAKLTLNNINSRYASVAALNDNFDLIETALENTLSRDGTTPNTMSANLDMNSKNILNAGTVNTNSLVVNGLPISPTAVNYTGVIKETQTATSGQTVFTLTEIQYDPLTNNLSVYIDGVYQNPSTYTETSSSVVTMSTGVHVGAVVDFVVFALNDLEGAGDAANITYTSAGAGAVTTTVQTKLRESVSVKDFGAVGDGVTDDTTAINLAIASLTTGGSLYFPKGTYQLFSPLVFSASNLTFYGDGASSVLRRDSSSANDYIFQSSGSGVLTNVLIEKLRFESQRTSASGTQSFVNFDGQDLSNITVQNCSFANTTAYCNSIFIKTAAGKSVSGVKILNNFIESSKRMGFEIINHDNSTNYNASDVLVEGNTFANCNVMCVSISGPVQNSTVSNNKFIGASTTNGLELVGPSGCNVVGNIFSGTFTSLISSSGTLTQGRNIVISDNSTNGLTTGRVYLANAGAATISGNNFQTTDRWNISGSGSNGCLIQSNRIVTSDSYAIICDNSANHRIIDNYLDNSASATNFAVVRAYNANATNIVLIGNILLQGTGGVSYDAQLGGSYLYAQRNIINGSIQDSLLPVSVTRLVGNITTAGTTSTATITLPVTSSWRPFQITARAMCCNTSGAGAGSAENHLNLRAVSSTTAVVNTSTDVTTSAGLVFGISVGTGTVTYTATVAAGVTIHWDIEVSNYSGVATVSFA